MFQEVRCLQSSFSLIFAPLRDLIEKEKQFNSLLRDVYFPAQLIEVSNGQGGEKSLLFSSHHGHSQIAVSNASITLNAGYSFDWQTREGEIKRYLVERVGRVFDLVEAYGHDLQLLFCGSVVRAQMRSNLSDDQLSSQLRNIFLKRIPQDPTHDLVIRHTTIVDGLFFNNITVQNYRTWNTTAVPVSSIRLAREQAAERGVEIIVDFNSRYAYNEEKEFVVNRGGAARVINLSFTQIAEAAADLLKEQQ